MANEFVHLHVHTDYSLLDGATPIAWKTRIKDKEVLKQKNDIVRRCQELGMTACALTDHGVMGGAVEFYEEMTAANLKPIFGCEVYVTPFDHATFRGPDDKRFHLILLAQNQTGYKNLCEIVSDAFLHGFYYKPRTDHAFLAAHSEGLIALSACIQGEIPRTLLEHGEEAAKKMLSQYVDIFGKENFYLEIQDHGIEEQHVVNKAFVKIAKEFELPLVATNDVHYLLKEHARAQDVLLCISTREILANTNRMTMMDHQEFYFKSPDEMAAVFGNELPESLSNTLAVAERCDVQLKIDKLADNHYPVYQISDEQKARGLTDQAAVLRDLVLGNVKRCYGYNLGEFPDDKKELEETIRQRIEYELSVIIKTKYPSYFLVVWDFIHYAKSQGIPVGLGRGSGAGSMVAYLTGITNVDPLRYDLLFERFLNPERVSPPDFDIDFCERRRGEVIEYVRNKYGRDSVAQIATYGALKAKNAIKDCARVLEFPPAFGDRMTKLIPEDPKMTLAKAAESPDFKALLESDPDAKRIYDEALPVEGLNRNTGIHACGVIIGDMPLAGVVPLQRSPEGDPVVQFTAHACEQHGLLKMDFLGLRTLTLISDTLENIRRNRGIDLDIDKIPLDDPKTYDLLNRGDTIAVFQLESGGMQKLCRSFGVETIDHIIALLALYRPGPMDFIPQFVACKKKLQPIEYEHPDMEKILSGTYGIMVYQEQIMQVVQVLAGFTLGHADIVRRAIGKKKLDIMEKERVNFIEGCKKTKNIAEPVAEKIWEKIKLFANYGFNKSHSAAYGIVSYRTAYLKANYRQEFMAATMTSELANSEKLTFLINHCRESGIKILPPDVNRSGVNFSVAGDDILFGLGAVKGFGEGVSHSIIEAREKDGPFTSLVDLLERTEGLNARSVESLVRCGALDFTGLKRSQLLAIIEESIACAASRKADRLSGQGNLFDAMFGGDDGGSSASEFSGDPIPPDIPELDQSERLDDEKKLLGFYVTGHPLDPVAHLVHAYTTRFLHELEEVDERTGKPVYSDGDPIRVAGMVNSYATKYSKKSGKPFGILVLEALDGTIECMLYERTLTKLKESGVPLIPGTPLLVEARVSRRDESEKAGLSVESVELLTEAVKTRTLELHLHLYADDCTGEKLKILAERVLAKPGDTLVVLCMVGKDDSVTFVEAPQHTIEVSKELFDYLDATIGRDHYKIKAKPYAPPPRRQWKKENPTEENGASQAR